MNKKILYIDMDGVIVDFQSTVAPYVPEVIEENYTPETYEARSKAVDKYALENPTLFENMEEIYGAIDAVKKLIDSNKYEIYFASTPMSTIPESYMGKRIWIRNKFGDWADKRLILTHRKDLLIGDYLIDDRTKNGAGEFKGELIHFATDRYPNWDSVLDKLLLDQYPKNITLTKLETLSDAEYPQEERYPSNSTVKHGLMWKFSLPKHGQSFSVLRSKLYPSFRTSIVFGIEKIDKNTMILTTMNSKYKLEINE